jgi:hypothetical protein
VPRRNCLQFVCVLTLLCGSMFGQTVSSSLMGTVTDPADAVIPGVPVQLISQDTGAVRTTNSDSTGMFRFLNLVPGAYAVTIKAAGFKAWNLKDLNLSTGETRDVGRIALAIGNLAEQIEVTAEATPVQVASSEKSALIDGHQLNTLALKGRDAFNFMQLLPGVLDTTNRETIGTGGDGGISVNGNTTSMTNMIDGITDRDAGAASGVHFVPNMDAIGEVKLLASNYQAEYGRNSGGVVTMVTKSGGQDFHGALSWVHRHEGFNANTYFNNLAATPGVSNKPRYRYNTFTWSLGGPVYIPGKFNKEKNKYFFFASQEFIRMFVPATLQKRTMPTAAERGGDFSSSLAANGNLIIVKDPATGTPFGGNQIPAQRIHSVGQKILQYFPLPNYVPAAGTSDYRNYNFRDEASYKRPVSDTVIRGDVYATSKLSGYFRLVRNRDQNDAYYQGIQWSQSTTKQGATMAQNHTNPGEGQAASVTYIFSPSTLNQFTYGHSRNQWTYWSKDAELLDRSLFGNMPWMFPNKELSNSLDNPSEIDKMHPFYPSANFGGGARPNPGTIGLGNYWGAYFNWNDIYVLQDNFTKVIGRHNIKAGVYAEKNLKTQPVNNNWSGGLDFAVDSLNPLDSGDTFANGLLGNFKSYNESNSRPLIMGTYWNFDFYVQDNWRVSRKLTLDFGLRMVHQESQYDRNHTFTAFREEQYSASKMPRMYQPFCDVTFTGSCPTGHRFGRDPGTGGLVPATAIGLFVPNSGDPATGMQVLGVNGVSKYAYQMRTFTPGPRVGAAYDVFGDGKMAIRGGFGIMYDRLEGNQVYNMSGVPPLTYIPYVYYSNISSVGGSGSSGLLGPTNVYPALYGSIPFTRVQNASVAVQRSLPGSMVAEVSFVGNWGRHLNQGAGNSFANAVGTNLNAIPLGTRFSNLDPTTGKALPDDMLRTKYVGYGNLFRNILEGSSSYYGLQTSVTRRYSRGLALGVAYTFSKSLGVTAFNQVVPNSESYFYGPNGNYRKHIFALNYSYDIPNLGQRLNNKVLAVLTDRYTLSGITTAQSGPPLNPICGSSTGADITGTPNLATGGSTFAVASRCLVVGDPRANVPAGRIFNPAAFALPPVGNVGNLGNNAVMGTGFHNWDVVLTKSLPIGLGEDRVFKLALQAYNVFNQAQFNAWNTSPTYSASADPSRLVPTNIGLPSGTRAARILATSLRFEF